MPGGPCSSRRRPEIDSGVTFISRSIDSATDADLAERVLKEATDGAKDEPEPQPENVTMGFWYVSPRRGPHRTTRQISAGTWDEVRPNYSASVAES
ncbi:DUF5925 domain-containing protein, partial [Streptomyces aureus]|uniref:DUF5925 domain-containing protein n=1 Tax=Streptomyces aureus TaxID=193461 RepID=UPI003F5D4F19